MKKHIILFSSVLLLGVALTVGSEVNAAEALEVKEESAAAVEADPSKFNIDGVVYTISDEVGKNEVTITNHIKNKLPEVVTISEKVTDPTTKIQYTVTGIGDGALGLGAEETDIVKEVSVPKTVLSIGGSAFSRRGEIRKIQLSDGVKTIGDFAFFKVSSLSEIAIPESVTSIGTGAFSGAKSLQKVNLPLSFTEIPQQLFEDCISLQVFTIPDNITLINQRAFRGAGLTEVRIPQGIVETAGLKGGAFATDTIRKITFTSPIVGGIFGNVFIAPIQNDGTFDGWSGSDGENYTQEDLSRLSKSGNITLTAKWKQGPVTPKPSTGTSDATIKLLERQPVGAVSFGSVSTDAAIVFNDITLNGAAQTTKENTSKTNAKVIVNDTRTDKTNGWKVEVQYGDTNFTSKNMKLELKPTSTSTPIVKNVTLTSGQQEIFNNGTAKNNSYSVLLNPELTIPKDFSAKNEQKTTVKWTLTSEV